MTRCAHWRRVPLDMLREAQRRSSSGHVDRAVQCQLFEHRTGDHYGFLDDAEYATASWLRWSDSEAALIVLTDCLATSADAPGEGCCLFEEHAGRHTWDEERSE